MPHRVFSWAVAGILLCALFAVVALVVYQTERNDQQNLRDQFQLRADVAETFLQTYVKEMLEREHSTAVRVLSDEQVSEPIFNDLNRTFGFKGSVVLDAAGTILNVYPAMPELRGAELISQYAHLRRALSTGNAVSDVVPSAVQSTPVVAFATRYNTTSGPRVFSGAFDVRATPLRAYMENLLEQEGAHADLMDTSGIIVASSRPLSPAIHSLSSIDPALSRATRAGHGAEFDAELGRKLFFDRAVTGTPWRLIISVEEKILYEPLDGYRRLLLWTLFGAFCVASVVAAYLLLRLRAVSQMHARLARVDRLTELPNRLHLEEHMARLVSAAARQGRPFSVFIVDVDHFKRVNDTYGHKAGDEVLHALSARMAKALRAEDMLGRWGGEEFLALLPNTSAEGACIVANRVRTMASSEPIRLSTGAQLQVTISIGCATAAGAKDETFVQRADEALYTAKKQGRDRVVSSAPPSARNDAETPALAHSS